VLRQKGGGERALLRLGRPHRCAPRNVFAAWRAERGTQNGRTYRDLSAFWLGQL